MVVELYFRTHISTPPIPQDVSLTSLEKKLIHVWPIIKNKQSMLKRYYYILGVSSQWDNLNDQNEDTNPKLGDIMEKSENPQHEYQCNSQESHLVPYMSSLVKISVVPGKGKSLNHQFLMNIVLHLLFYIFF